MNLSDASEEYINYLRYRKNATATTVRTYSDVLRPFIHTYGGMDSNGLTVHHIDSFATTLTTLKPKTRRNKLTIIRCFVRWMYARDYVDFKAELIDLPKEEAQEANFLTPEEAKKFLSAVDNTRDRAMLLVMVTSGVRVSELTNLKLIDLYERSLAIENGKGRKPRITFITPECAEAVDVYVTSKRGKRPGYLFPNPKGQALSRACIGKIVSHYADKAGIEKHVSPHTLRHTFATSILMKGARIEDTQEMMGHNNIRTTRMYLHFTNDYLKQRYDQFMLTDEEV